MNDIESQKGVFDCFPIRELSARTQVNTVTLRAWERRYGLLNPKRTAKGHRLYSEDDVLIVERVMALVARGVPLGKVKPLLSEDESIVTQDDQSESWKVAVDNLIDAAKSFSANKVEKIIYESFANYPAPICRERLLEPAFVELGLRDDDNASVNFAESEVIRYACFRLNAKGATPKGADSIVLQAGDQAAMWRLSVAAVELMDLGFAVHLLCRPVTLSAAVVLGENIKDAEVIFYQDGVWKEKQCRQAVTGLQDNDRMMMCGTAPMLMKTDTDGRVFGDLSGCIDALLKFKQR